MNICERRNEKSQLYYSSGYLFLGTGLCFFFLFNKIVLPLWFGILDFYEGATEMI